MKKKSILYVSSWSHAKAVEGAGIHVYELYENGSLLEIQNVDSDTSFNVTVVDESRGLLYAVNETEKLPESRSAGGGRIFTYSIDIITGKLTCVDKRATWCPNPCYFALDRDGKFAIVPHHASGAAATKIVLDDRGEYAVQIVYDDSAVELFEVEADGGLGKLTDVVKHAGCGPYDRQIIPRPHCAVMCPDGSFFAVCDKGNDSIYMYKIDRENGKLLPSCEVYKCEAGSMPRYSVFHPSLPYFYHNNEYNLDVCAYRYDKDGQLSPIGSYSCQPESYIGVKGMREQQGMCIHPNGRYIYDIGRGPNVIAVFEINEADGSLKLIQTVEFGDTWPRGCNISPDGTVLAATGLAGGKLSLFAVGEDGRLKAINTVEQTAPAYTSFFSI